MDELKTLVEAILPALTIFVMPFVVQLVKQPRFEGTKWNVAIAYGTSVAVAIAGLWAAGQPIDVTQVGAMVAAANIVYAFWFKGTSIADALASVGIPKTNDDVYDTIDIQEDDDEYLDYEALEYAVKEAEAGE